MQIVSPAVNTRFPDTVINPDTRIVEVLAGLAAHTFKTWCFPSQEKLLELLYKFTGRTMSRRTLNRHLAALERDGHISRKRRHIRDKKLGLILRSTLYTIGGRFMARIGRIVEASARWKQARADAKNWRGKPGVSSRSGIHVPSLAQNKEPSLKGYKKRE